MNDQILVVRLTCLLPAKERQLLYEQILHQMPTGCVVLPPGTEALLVPKDVEIKFEEASNGAKRKIGELVVDVKPRISIDDQSAVRCLRLLEMYLTDHPDLTVECSWKDYDPTGHQLEMRFVKLRQEVDHGTV